MIDPRTPYPGGTPHGAPPGAPATGLDDDHLHALVDGRLPHEEAQALRRQLEDDPANRERVQAWEAQRKQLRGLHAHWEEAPVPPLLAQAAQDFRNRRLQASRAWSMAGLAASLVLAFGLGWTLHGTVRPADPASATLASPAPSTLPPTQRFALQAAAAHAVYQPEQRHPVEVGAAQQEHLVQWLSRRLGRPLHIPDLQPQGYELVGGRLLPGDASPGGASGARAQFMYQNAAGQRVTLYLGALPAAPAETAFRYEGDGPVPSFYWVEDGFGYALSGPLPRDALLAIATAVHPQL
ncbi:putative transmembrane anti-sigma factor [Paracidovorax avenae ATCC 19860]|uniref:Putative transmembrane anti-sigma factor n=1 Tax=Paracidovorax avenae (strain ATCC 19860 / DSM 7227 / CCUG 15838 / JCM 20985 / LMG 2117 / NCPPB 1011) TaxID=643561 RepID=F0Q7A2_PARA1|nr:anti-sigma factor [Paracidovorax avenae]ADX45777.1 putative transmembrane anti-sigma factor [Paracidovorax avenae ATCC 19860]